jgi:hypothetical protein
MSQVEVFAEGNKPEVITSREIRVPARGFENSEDTVLSFELPDLVFGVQFRVIVWPGTAPVRVRAAVRLIGPS